MNALERLRERLGTAGLLLLAVSIASWAVMLLGPWPRGMPGHGGSGSSRLEYAHSAVMVAAMMAPALSGPYLHLWFRSLTRHRWRALTLFTVAYLLVWAVAADLLSKAAALALNARAGTATLVLMTLALLAWQFSPARAICLARCHLRPRISVFGPSALLDPIRFGISIATWCVASCWALMELAHVWRGAELPLLAGATIVIAMERSVERQGSPPTRLSLAARLRDCWWTVRTIAGSSRAALAR